MRLHPWSDLEIARRFELATARQEATRAKLEQERLASELDVARSRIDQSAEALRSELRRMEEVAEETAQAPVHMPAALPTAFKQ